MKEMKEKRKIKTERLKMLQIKIGKNSMQHFDFPDQSDVDEGDGMPKAFHLYTFILV